MQVEVGRYNADNRIAAALGRPRPCYNDSKAPKGFAGEATRTQTDDPLLLCLYLHYDSLLPHSGWVAVIQRGYMEQQRSIRSVHLIQCCRKDDTYGEAWPRHIPCFLRNHGKPDWLFVLCLKPCQSVSRAVWRHLREKAHAHGGASSQCGKRAVPHGGLAKGEGGASDGKKHFPEALDPQCHCTSIL